MMKALYFDRFGEPGDVLQVRDIPPPQASEGWAVVKVQAASVNPSDAANVAGRFAHTTLPRIPGRDYAGVVVEGPVGWLNQPVWGTGDGGFTYHGSHAEYLAVPVASLSRRPHALTPEQAASVGVTFVVAWQGIVEYARLDAGETLVVIGASGGVGNAAIQLGQYLGARVIGIDHHRPPGGSAAAHLTDAIITPDAEDAAEAVRHLTHGRGADVVLNAVGGPTFEPSLSMLAHRGRLLVLASPGARRQTFDLVDFYHNETQLLGIDSLKRDMVASARILDTLAPGFEDGTYTAPAIGRRIGLMDAPAGYAAMSRRTNGRTVILPGLD